MKALICKKYGPADEVFEYTHLSKPVPRVNEVLIRVRATTVNAADSRVRSADFPSIYSIMAPIGLGFGGPRRSILGVELAGDIEAVGSKVTRFAAGDKVFASTGMHFGAYAEYVCLKETAEMCQMPSNMTYQEAAAVPHCALTALYYLQKGDVGKGQDVLIYGASGGIGTFAVQIAKAFGARVTGVCSTTNIELVKTLGADQVIDYTVDDLSGCQDKYDAIFDTIGKSPYTACVKMLKDDGKYLLAVHMELSRVATDIWTNLTTSKKIIGGVAAFTVENMKILRDMIEQGQVRTAIDRTYTFEQIPEAHAYVDTGHKRGHVAITVS